MKSTACKFISATLIISLIYQIGFPFRVFALTSGPSQPEVQAFEPVGTTEMVDLFSGDFVYNIPLLDIDGYPINISYHSGISMEQEASWVGLGWSLNPGEINRSVRGVPDDFNGDKILKHVYMDDEKNYMGKIGAQFKPELFGFGSDELGLETSIDLSLFMNMNNYKGVSASMRAGGSFAFKLSSGNQANSIGFSPSIGVGSQSGVDLDASLQYSNEPAKTMDQNAYKKSLSIGSGINSRNGVRGINFSAGISVEKTVKDNSKRGMHIREVGNSTFSTTVPIGIQNYVPVVTNSSSLLSFGIQGRLGGELWGGYGSLLLGFTYSKMQIDPDGDRDAFGYMYLENAPDDKKGILDFIRDKDGIYNKTIQNLPMSSLAYDVFSVSGQGTGGSFRPFRNDIGTVYDPDCGTENFSGNLAVEVGVGGYFELGADVQFNRSIVHTGAWLTSDFQGEQPGSLYEKLFYKAAGELTYNRQLANNAFYSGVEPLNLSASYGGNPFVISRNVGNLNFSNSAGAGSLGNPLTYNGMKEGRTARGNNIVPLTARKASDPLYSPEPTIRSYSGHVPGSIVVDEYSRLASNYSQRKYGSTTAPSTNELADKISLITQVLPDGKRYVYGIPAQNNISKDVTFGATDAVKNSIGGLIGIGASIAGAMGSTPGPEHYRSYTETPGSAHAFLLTEVLSPDYVDITGNGISDDDLGGFVKLNYTLTSNDYRWRSPAFDLDTPSHLTAHLDPGFQSDPNDGKASVSMGSREQWYVHSIESKNTIAEFYTSPRFDGYAMNDAYLSKSVPSTNNPSFDPNGELRDKSLKLDSIRLFNKNERIQNGTSAIPIKTVIFEYDYSLCGNTPNSTDNQNENSGHGKLTLKKILIRYGSSDKNLLNPYQFQYNDVIPNYDYNRKDRWGNVNVMDPAFSGLDPFEFPYTSQVKYPAPNTDPVTAFSLTDITLPSGGKIHVDYEADDYAFVQDKRAMQMFKVEGFGFDSSFHSGSALYEGDRQYNYAYFKRDLSREYKSNPTDAELQEMYLGNEKLLYFSVSTDVNGNNAFEQIKGFAKVVKVGRCTGSQSDYGYVQLEKVNSNNCDFSPVTLYAMNYAKWNLNHIIYPGNNTASLKEVLDAFGSAIGEIGHMRRPLQTFLERGYCKGVKLGKSWIRLACPNYTKKGGGTRVKRLTANDEWSGMTNSSAQQTGTYGRDYIYTYFDKSIGATISSGVASYEPLIGGDENPLRQPIPYTAAENLALPAMEFYQLEPMGENFYPGGMVGYSSVTVRSIHIDQGKSSMSEEEDLFYTAKDFPIRVDRTNKNTNSLNHWSFFVQSQLEQASQGYTLYLNDMHGKPKGKFNYLVLLYDNSAANPKVDKRTLISGIRYNYNTGSDGKLSSNVRACRLAQSLPGAPFQYVIENMELGKESDLVFDSRQNFDEFESLGANGNLNTIAGGFIPIPFVTVFPTGKIETTVFHSAVATKIIQQYGILKSVDVYQEDETTPIITTENLIYDAESGNVLLTKTNNEFGDPEFSENLPAFLAYESMGPSYTNHGFKDKPSKIYINTEEDGYMDVSDLTKYSEGDELLYEDAQGNRDKLWITKKGMISPAEYFGYKYDKNKVCAAFFSGSNITYQISLMPVSGGPSTSVETVPYPSNIWNHTFSSLHMACVLPGVYDISISMMQSGVLMHTRTAYNISLSASTPLLMYGVTMCDPSDTLNTPPPPPPAAPMPPGVTDPGSSTTNFQAGAYCLADVSTSKCMVRVNPRYKSIKAAAGGPEQNWWVSGTLPKTLTNFTTEIVRSGRRNMLGDNIQSLVSTSFPSPTAITSLSGLLPTSGLISVSARTYTNSTAAFDQLDYSLKTNTAGAGNLAVNQYEGLNEYVLGLKGNFRPYQQFTAFADRAYGTAATSHSRVDGLFSLGTNGSFWQPGIPNCGTWNILNAAGITNINLWKKASEITKYDQFGNALEEEDALQIPSAVRFGYANRLPVCVAHNARQQNICFEGFEDLSSKAVPEAIARLLYNVSGRLSSGFFQSSFSQVFNGIASAVSLAAGQIYIIPQSTGNYINGSGTLLKSSQQNGRAHTGTWMLSIPANTTIDLPVANADVPNSVQSFNFLKGGKYLMNMWVRTGNTSAATPPFSVSLLDNTSTSVGTTAIRTIGTPIDGWQLFEATIDMTSIPAATSLQPVHVTFGAQAIIDDVRIMPYSANLKSFVYDVDNNDRICAELDENHYATFFEYDQEGQLVRVKKETEKGIVTLNESRRAFKKY